MSPLCFAVSPLPTTARHKLRLTTTRKATTTLHPLRRLPYPTACLPAPSRRPTPDVAQDTPSALRDGPFGHFAITMFRRVMTPHIGWKSPRAGYDGFVEECRMLLARKGPIEQQRIVFSVLNTLFQAPYGTKAFRRFFSPLPQFNSLITPLFFKWLVGPCSNNRPEEGGYGVYIEKCRFLDESGCKGLCVNMCQQPTQNYFTHELGLPVRMTPNYEDSSCQMTFGVAPLPVEEDPAVTGECLAHCKMAGSFQRRSETDSCYSTKKVLPLRDPDSQPPHSA